MKTCAKVSKARVNGIISHQISPEITRATNMFVRLLFTLAVNLATSFSKTARRFVNVPV